MKTAIIVQARMGSSRLPGKVLKPILGRPMLSFQLERLQKVKQAQLLVATTMKPADHAISKFCAENSIECYRGPERDVLARYYLAAKFVAADTIVRVTADCPLIEPELIDQALTIYQSLPAPMSYVSNMLEPTYPYGMAVEIFSFTSLQMAHENAALGAEREHVTPYLYWHPELFHLHSLTQKQNLSQHRWTVDTPEDFELVERLLSHLYPINPSFRSKDILKLLKKHPDWSEINSKVQQKTVNQIDRPEQ